MSEIRSRAFSMKASLAGLALGASLALSLEAQAFCPARSCDPKKGEPCDVRDGCIVTGEPLRWRENCVITVGVQRDGSALHGIDGDALLEVTQRAFQTWQSADCGGGKTPSIQFAVLGDVRCAFPEYNEDSGNLNGLMIRDTGWPYEAGSDELGHTALTFDTFTGELQDADIEINGDGVPLTLNVTDGGADLLSILTHEAGHFLGLAHSTVRDATMYPNTDFGNPALASLAQDDIDGICALYPPSPSPPKLCAPKNRYSPECGGGPPLLAPNPLPGEPLFCALNVRSHVKRSGQDGLGLILGLLTALGSRRRRSAR